MLGGDLQWTVDNFKSLRASGAMGASGDLKVSSGRPEFCVYWYCKYWYWKCVSEELVSMLDWHGYGSAV
jgi:hypothetical protein